MITTTGHPPWLLDVPITNLSSAGLKSASMIRMKLFTLDNVLVLKKIGVLAKADQATFKKSLRQLFNF